MKKIRLSQCMIVKNEEKNIRQALSWGKGIVCEQIVVDTGSTDRTVEIAQEMGAKVFHFEWISDFAAAKNYALEQASGDWIAFLDADEYFREEDAASIMPLLKKMNKIKKTGQNVEVILCDCICLEDDGKPFLDASQIRLFRNQKSLRYTSRIHEHLMVQENGVMRNPKGYDMTKRLPFIHTGYSRTAYKETNKLQRNLQLLEKELEENPDNWEMMVYLGGTYESIERYEEAHRILRRVMEQGLDQIDEVSKNMLFKQLIRNIINWKNADKRGELELIHQKAIQLGLMHPDIDYYLGVCYFNMGDYEKSFSCMESALKLAEMPKGNQNFQITAEYDRAYYTIAMASYMLKRYADTVRYGVLCLRANLYHSEMLICLLKLLKEEPGEAETAAGTVGILEQIYDFKRLKDKLFVRKCAQVVGFEKLESLAEGYLTQEERLILDKKG